MWEIAGVIANLITATAALTSALLAMYAAREASRAKDEARARQAQLEESQRRLDQRQRRLDQNQLILNAKGKAIGIDDDAKWAIYFTKVESGAVVLDACKAAHASAE